MHGRAMPLLFVSPLLTSPYRSPVRLFHNVRTSENRRSGLSSRCVEKKKLFLAYEQKDIFACLSRVMHDSPMDLNKCSEAVD
jgi:hypothetical protein